MKFLLLLPNAKLARWMAFFALLLVLTPAAAQSVKVDAVWVNTARSVLKLDLDELKLLKTIDVPGIVLAQAVDPVNLTLWVITPHEMRAYDFEGNLRFVQPFRGGLHLFFGTHLAVDTNTGALWVAMGQDLYRYSADGTTLDTIRLSQFSNDIAIDSERGIVWVSTWRGLIRLDRNMEVLDTIAIPRRGGHIISAMAVSPQDGSLWVGYINDIQRFTATGEPAEIIDLKDVDRRFSNIDTLAIDAENHLWVAGKRRLYRITPQGERKAKVVPFRRGIVTQAATASSSNQAWVKGFTGVARVDATGEVAARFYWPGFLFDISVSADRIAPVVQFAAPPVDSIVRPQSEFTLTFSDTGAGVDPATFTFMVNGAETPFNCQATASTSTSEAICTPAEPLSGTPLIISATVADFAGNVSEPATRSFRLDTDGDSYTDDIDVFSNDPTEWADLDGDGIGDNSDPDRDGDGHANDIDVFPDDPNEWADTDSDGIGDNSDPDIDGDGHLNEDDIFPLDPTEWADFDGDGIGDNSDPDRDGDGISNDNDAFPDDPSEWSDLDGDGTGDNSDSDMDGDGVLNIADVFPFNPAEWADLDGDGIGNNSDTDIDGDGTANNEDAFPMDPAESADIDGDGIGDNADSDRDGDGQGNEEDTFPDDSTEWQDTDHDGAGDNTDPDIDNDGVVNGSDAFPEDPTESADIDGDGTGDNADLDRDGDGHNDTNDAYPSDPARWNIPVVTIHRPKTLTTVGASPVNVFGEVSDPQAMLMINGMHVENQDGLFTADVSLDEGYNSIAVRAIDPTGAEVTASVVITLDTTEPDISVSRPQEGAVLYTPTISVTGLANDIVRGMRTVNDAVVTVNGVPATVSNRSFLAENVALVEGENTIRIEASDAVGNIAVRELHVTYQPLTKEKITIVSGQGQQGTIRQVLDNTFVVKLTSELDKPIKDKIVVFRVTQGDGVLKSMDAPPSSTSEERALLVTTDETGYARARFKLGSMAGQGNHKVSVHAVGFETAPVFYASANPQPGDKISVIVGNNQYGAIHSPLPRPMVVAVTDAGGNLVPGASVRFEISKGITDGATFRNGATVFETVTDTDGRASVHLILGREGGFDRYRVTATLTGTEAAAGFTASALVPGNASETSITGIVLDNQDQPIEGVTLRILGTTRQAISGPDGRFKVENVPVGPVHLVADGATAKREGVWPTLGFELTPVAGAVNPLPRPVYLLPLNTESSKIVGNEDVTLTLPEVPGFALEIQAGSATFPDGSRVGRMSVTAVNPSKLPSPPPNGMQPQFIVTIQPVEVQFDPPARLTLPNVDGYLPGAQVEMFSYSHSLEEFVTIGWGTVSEDAATITSNEGIGVVESGWHCGTGPSGSGCGHSCDPICEQCDGNCSCTFLPDNPLPNQQPDDCQIMLCGGTEFNDETAALQASQDQAGDCSTPFCNAATQGPDTKNDPGDLDESSPDARCEMCENKSQVADPSKEGNNCSDVVGQACYVCQDGQCKKPKCDASTTKNTFTTHADQKIGELVKLLVDDGLARIPSLKLETSISASISVEEGEECCKDCRDSNDPVPYEKREGKIRLGVTGKMAIPGFGVMAEFGPYIKTVLSWQAEVSGGFTVGLSLEGKGNTTYSVSRKSNICEHNEPCNIQAISLYLELTGKAGLEANIKLEVTDILWDQPISQFEVVGEASTSITTSGEARAAIPEGDCEPTDGTCLTFNGVTWNGIVIKAAFKTNYFDWNFEHTLGEPYVIMDKVSTCQ